MPRTWITDLNHYLEDGKLYSKLPPPALKFVEFLGAIVAAITSAEPDDPLGVRCKPRPGRRKCSGEIEGYISPESDRIQWMCLDCGDNGVISGWQGTMWDCRDAGERTRH